MHILIYKGVRLYRNMEATRYTYKTFFFLFVFQDLYGIEMTNSLEKVAGGYLNGRDVK